MFCSLFSLLGLKWFCVFQDLAAWSCIPGHLCFGFPSSLKHLHREELLPSIPSVNGKPFLLVVSLHPLSPAHLQVSWSPLGPARGSLEPSPLQMNSPWSLSLSFGIENVLPKSRTQADWSPSKASSCASSTFPTGYFSHF